MTYKIVVTNMALADIRSAALYISNTLMNKSAANRLLDAVDEKFEELSEKSLNFELCKYLHPTQFTNNRLCHYIYKNVKVKAKMNANAVLTFTFL